MTLREQIAQLCVSAEEDAAGRLRLVAVIKKLSDERDCLRFAVRMAVGQKEYDAILETAAHAHGTDLAPLLAQFLEKGTI